MTEESDCSISYSAFHPSWDGKMSTGLITE